MTYKFRNQPVIVDKHGTHRFARNRIITHLLDDGPFDMNHLAVWCHQNGISQEERAQFAQLIGYSVSGYSDLSYADDDSVEEGFRESGLLALGDP